MPPSEPVLSSGEEQPVAISSDMPTEVWQSIEIRHQTLPITSTGRRRLPLNLWFMALLIPYAIGATIAVVYLLQQQERLKGPHILESIPDQGLYEDFLDGRRPEVMPPVSKAGEGNKVTRIIPPNEPIGQEIAPVKLGETRRVGQLEVMPVSVSKQKIQYAWRGGKQNVEGDEALVLKLQIKNVGPIIFRPDDETFNRSVPNEGKAPVYTFLEMGKERFYGAISDPTTERLSEPLCGSLAPGETGIMLVYAVKNSDGRRNAAQVLQPDDACVWRVHLRRGKEEVTLSAGKKRSVWLTTVVPVHFSGASVK